jgi:YD repeat-containing protein
MNKNKPDMKYIKFYKTMYLVALLMGGVMLLGMGGAFAQTVGDTIVVDTLPAPIKKRVLQSSAAAAGESQRDVGFRTKLPTFMKESPEVMSFKVATQVPVNMYAGRADISLPIFSLSGQEVATSVGLSYNGTGVKVEQEATQVGLGWSLSAGGMITRQIRGRDDFDGILRFGYPTQVSVNNLLKGIYDITPLGASNNVVYQFNQLGDASSNFDVQSYISFLAYSQQNGGPCAVGTALQLPSYTEILNLGQQLSSIGLGEEYGMPILDMQPDLFTYQAGAYSGKFVISIDVPLGSPLPYVIYTQGQEAVKIEIENNTSGTPDYTGQSGFKITTPDGNIFLFKVYEEAKSLGGISKSGKITNPELPLISDPINSAAEIEWDASILSKTQITGWHLTKISSPHNNQDEITFTYVKDTDFSAIAIPSKTQNLTMYGGAPSALWRITDSRQKNVRLTNIQANTGSISFHYSPRLDIRGAFAAKLDSVRLLNHLGTHVKSMVFGYDYFDAGNTQPDFVKKRLKLLSLTERSKSGLNLPPHTFEYFDKMIPYVGNLPGAEITVLLPSKTSYAQDFWGYFNGENGNDTKVNTSTGGNNSANFLVNNGTMIPAYIAPLSTGDNNLGFVNKAERNPVLDFAKIGTLSAMNLPTGGQMRFDYEFHGFNNYTLDQAPNSFIVSNLPFSSSITKYGAGLRIASTRLLADKLNQSNYLQKKYEYTEARGVSNLSSGRLMYDLRFAHIVDPGTGVYQVLSSGTNYPLSYSANGSPVGYNKVREYTVDYANPNPIAIGYTEFDYINTVDIAHNTYCFKNGLPFGSPQGCGPELSSTSYTSCTSYLPINDASGSTIGFTIDKIMIQDLSIPNYVNPRNGLIQMKTVFNNNDQILLKEEYTYTTPTNTVKKRLKSLTAKSRGNADPYPALFTYYNDMEWIKLENKTVTSFYPPNPDGIVNTEAYLYNSENKLVNETTNTNSKSETIKTSITYTVDDPLTLAMKNKRMWIQPVTQTLFNVTKNKELSKQINTYKNFSGVNGMILLEKTRAYQQGYDDAIEDAIIDYTDAGDVKQTISRNEPVTSYLWAYNGNYAVAKIVNATSSQVEAALLTFSPPTSVAILNFSSNAAYIEDVINKLRVALPSAYVTTILHKPLIGQEKMVAPNGISTSYQYDSFNRLIEVKDTNGKILKTNTYNYKGQ